jgi:hypothetical protein
MGVAALLVAGLPGSGWAQRGAPLLKTDLIALLSNPVISAQEIASLVRRNCLAFRPTDRDLANIRHLGASPDVVASVAECAMRRPPSSATPFVAPVPAASSLQVVLRQPRVAAAAGTEARTVVLAARGGFPQPGVSLALRGSAVMDGGGGRDAVAVTDDSGFAAFRFPAGRRLGTYRLEVAPASGGTLPGRPVIELVVRPGPAAFAKILPGEIVFDQGLDSIVPVEIAVRDSIGYPVAGEPVVLRGNAEGIGFRPDTAVTDSLGRARLVVIGGRVRRGGTLQVAIGGRQLGRLDVVVGAPLLEATTGFLLPATLHGYVGNRLAEPLVFEARTRLGQPAVRRAVSFRAMNATVSPAATTTDSVGRARIEVALGERVGPAVVVATIDSLEKVVTLQVEPGPAVELVLEHHGLRVNGRWVGVGLDTTFVVRLRTLDAYGNTTDLAGLARMLRETPFDARIPIVHVVSIKEEPSAVALTLKAIRTGRATIRLRTADINAAFGVEVVDAR